MFESGIGHDDDLATYRYRHISPNHHICSLFKLFSHPWICTGAIDILALETDEVTVAILMLDLEHSNTMYWQR